MVKIICTLILFVLSSFWSIAFCQTTRYAKVIVKNETGHTLNTVSVQHKYSNDPIQKGEWRHIPNGQFSSSIDVNYRTDLFTTGVDWWIVSWGYEGEDGVYITDPNNLQSVVDVLFQFLPELTNFTVNAACNLVSAGQMTETCSYGAEVISKAVARQPGDSSAGWKQHILGTEDENQITTIVIKPKSVEFRSHSGISSTEDPKYIPQGNSDGSNNQMGYIRNLQMIYYGETLWRPISTIHVKDWKNRDWLVEVRSNGFNQIADGTLDWHFSQALNLKAADGSDWKIEVKGNRLAAIKNGTLEWIDMKGFECINWQGRRYTFEIAP